MKVREACIFFGKGLFSDARLYCFVFKSFENRDDDEYYAPMIFQLTHEKIIIFEHYLVLRSKYLEIRRNTNWIRVSRA